MQYVIGYSVSALLFLCVLTVRFLNSRQINSYKNLFFVILLISGNLYIAGNIIFCCMMSYFSVIPEVDLVLVKQLSGLFQFGVPHLFFLFSQVIFFNFRERWKDGRAGEHGMFLASVLYAAAMTVQWFYPMLLFSNVGAAVYISILYAAFCDADRTVDAETGCFNGYGLQRFLEDGVSRKKVRYGMVVYLETEQRQEAVRELLKAAEKNAVYRLEEEVFLILCKKKEQYQKLRERLYGRFAYSGIADLEIEQIGKELPAFLKYAVGQKDELEKAEEHLLTGELWEKFRRVEILGKYLQKAIEENLFSMEYQPIWSVEQKKFVMLEALVRLKHPEYGVVSPAEFIPMAEELGLITQVTACVLEQVTSFMGEKEFQQLSIENIKINLSAMDFLQEDLEERLAGMLARKRLAPTKISLELTETAATRLGEEIQEKFQKLKNLGVTLTMDDFGSGYANLESVIQLNFDTVKIDRSMLVKVVESAKSRALYRNLVSMLKELGLSVVAEGAETEEQVRLLEAWKVDYIQGFYFSKPLTREKVLEKLK